MRILLALLLACAVCGAAAQDEVLVGRLPQNLAPGGAIGLARAALLGRSWKVLASDATSVTAQAGNSQVRVYVAGDTLRYANDGGREPAPPRLIATLRADLASALGQDLRAASATGAPAAPLSGRAVMTKPADVDAATMMRAVRIGLEARRLTLLPSADENVVVAQYATRTVGSTWHVFLVGSELQMTAKTTRMARGGGEEAIEMPERWIENLRFEIENAIPRAKQDPRAGAAQPALAAREAQAPAANSQPRAGSATERLRSLKQLFDSGAVTRDEYDQKRAEILRDL